MAINKRPFHMELLHGPVPGHVPYAPLAGPPRVFGSSLHVVVPGPSTGVTTILIGRSTGVRRRNRRRVVGRASAGSFGYGSAFIWHERYGMRNLKTVLSDRYRAEFGGWQLQEATGITPDARTVVGNGGNPTGHLQGWVARLDPLHLADWNRDAVVSSADFLLAPADFFAGRA